MVSSDAAMPSAMALRWLAMPMPFCSMASAWALAATTVLVRSASASALGSLLIALSGVDGVHGALNVLRQLDIGDKRRDDVVAVARHELGDGILHVLGDEILVVEHLVKRVARDRGAQRVGDIAFHLIDGVAQDVVATVDARLLNRLSRRLIDAELNRNGRADGHVILRLTVKRVAGFLRAQIDVGGAALDERDQEMEAGVHDAVELAKAPQSRSGHMAASGDGRSITPSSTIAEPTSQYQSLALVIIVAISSSESIRTTRAGEPRIRLPGSNVLP